MCVCMCVRIYVCVYECVCVRVCACVCGGSVRAFMRIKNNQGIKICS